MEWYCWGTVNIFVWLEHKEYKKEFKRKKKAEKRMGSGQLKLEGMLFVGGRKWLPQMSMS